MEVTPGNFEALFPRIIDAYTRCYFIAIDCEFSGVRCPSKDIQTAPGGGSNSASSKAEANREESEKRISRAALVREKAYIKLKSAAQMYTVLQLGVTFAWLENGDRIGRAVERDIAVKSSSVQFLQSAKFNFYTLLREGLRYVTHAEEKKIRESISAPPKKGSQDNYGEEKAEEEEEEDYRIQAAISDRLANDGIKTEERLKLFPLDGKPMARSWISRVHSVTRVRFDDCVSWKGPREGCIVIKHVDRAVEEERHAERVRRMSASIRKAIGLRNVLDLILGNDLSGQVIPEEFAEAQITAAEHDDDWGPRSEAEKDRKLEAAINTLNEKLELLLTPRSPPILVGHNLAWDVAFLTEAFLHPLPDGLEEFVRTVDGMFPRLLDTRVLAANHSDDFRDFDLSAIHAALIAEGEQPRCYWAPGMGYRSESAHDAGCDSLITASVFLKMGQKLVGERGESRDQQILNQALIIREIADWGSSIWDRFRGKFVVQGHMVRD
ncbi:uncharacterized protein DNG_03768 [Cephalotrichum gorgonifer]|uniref:CAF1 domain-containing protein n=1 Tax=Cephalotrichum gorgonifer TaxID=2041049 RepID=A0AAE8STY0_9PEZI|nr:uncharacterized protein DNG_03768 [Cephalotrichum gorgonifer]